MYIIICIGKRINGQITIHNSVYSWIYGSLRMRLASRLLDGCGKLHQKVHRYS